MGSPRWAITFPKDVRAQLDASGFTVDAHPEDGGHLYRVRRRAQISTLRFRKTRPSPLGWISNSPKSLGSAFAS